MNQAKSVSYPTFQYKSNGMEYLRKLLNVQHPVIEYQGTLTQEIILTILHDLEMKLERYGEKMKVTRKAFNIITECLQNIARYGDEIEDPASKPVFILDRQPSRYVIATGNLVHISKMDNLKNKIDGLNKLDENGIQQAYKERIKFNLVNKDKKRPNSAGLGLIEMIRKSEQKLYYEFKKIHPEYYIFCLVITILK